ncbi:MAG: hypothetical protein IJ400_04495 [Clostridia bacterium]|nr:hypothetical protein [Clostridia bacterium]
MNTFETKTNPKFAIKIYGLTMLITYLALALLGLLLLSVNIKFFILAEALILVCMGISALISIKNNSKFTFVFEGNVLHINGVKPAQEWVVYDIPASDFIITQSKGERECDCCTVKIKDTAFKFYGVESYAQLKNYIESNF